MADGDTTFDLDAQGSAQLLMDIIYVGGIDCPEIIRYDDGQKFL